MATTVAAGIDAASSVQLNEALTRGGVSVARINTGGAGTFWAAPQDNRRRYISFSLVDPALTVVISPGDDNQPNGYTLHANESIIEFGGDVLAPLVESIWHLTSVGIASIDVTVIRD